MLNATNIAWESALAGTDMTLGVDASEILQFSGAFNATAITEGTIAVLNNDEIDASSELLAIMDDETGTGVLVFGTSPTFTTSIVSPLVIGGAATTADLSLQTTSGIGEAGADMHFLVGNNGATEAMTILNSGLLGIGTTAPDAALEINHATGDSLRLTYNDSNGSAVNYTDLSLSSAGALTLTGSAATLGASATAEKTFLTLAPGIITLTAPTQVTSLMETAVLTGATIAADAALTVDKAATLSLSAPVDSTNVTLTDSSSLRILNETSGAGTLTSQYGLYIENLTAGTNDYGVYIAGADTYALWADTGTTRLDGTLQLGSAGATLGVMTFNGNTSGTITIQSAAAAGTYTLTLPADDGTANQFLQTDGSGALVWATPAGSGDITAVGDCLSVYRLEISESVKALL